MDNTTALVCTLVLGVCIIYAARHLSTSNSPHTEQHKQQHHQKKQTPAAPLSEIEVYVSPQCHHCVAMKPEIDKLQSMATEKGIQMRLVLPSDGDVEAMMSSRNIQYFPCILLRGVQYTGERTAQAILDAFEQ